MPQEPQDPKLTIPTVHPNGSDKQDLIDGYTEAGQAVQVALNKLRSAVPYGRDYYVQENNPFYEAIAEHNSRMQRLQTVLSELETLASRVTDQ